MKQTRETLDEEMGKREGGWGKKAFARLSIALISGNANGCLCCLVCFFGL